MISFSFKRRDFVEARADLNVRERDHQGGGRGGVSHQGRQDDVCPDHICSLSAITCCIQFTCYDTDIYIHLHYDCISVK